MKNKTKNRLVFRFQLIFFTVVIFVTMLYEFLWLINLLDPYNLLSFFIPESISTPPIQKMIFSIVSAVLMQLNWALAIFSLYSFIYILRILESNPENTLPICAISLDIMIITQFLFQVSLFDPINFANNLPSSIFYLVPNFLTKNSAVFIIFAIFSILISLKFGIEGYYNRRKVKPNFISDLIHLLMVTNSFLVLGALIFYINVFRIDFIVVFGSILFSIFLFSLLIIVMKKKNIKFPINAIARHNKRKERLKLNSIN